MFFSRVFTVALPIFAAGLALAAPIAAPADLVVKRVELPAVGAVDPQVVLSTLKGEVEALIPQLDDIVGAGGVTLETLGPITEKLQTSITNAVTALSAGDIGAVKGEIFAIVSGLVADLTTISSTLLSATGALPVVAEVAGGVNSSLTQLVAIVDTFIPGFGNFITPIVNSLNPTQILGSVTGVVGGLLGGAGL